MNNGVLYVLPLLNPNVVLTTNPIDLYDVSTGTPVHTHYELPNPSSGVVGQIVGHLRKWKHLCMYREFETINNTPRSPSRRTTFPSRRRVCCQRS